MAQVRQGLWPRNLKANWLPVTVFVDATALGGIYHIPFKWHPHVGYFDYSSAHANSTPIKKHLSSINAIGYLD